MTKLTQDLKYGLRILARNPGTTLLAVLALGLGIGANTAIFSFADLLLRRPVALPELHRLVSVTELRPDAEAGDHISPANYYDLRAMNRSFESLAAYRYWGTNLTGKAESESVLGVRVTADFFPTIRMAPAMGRSILPEEEEPGKNHVAMVSDGFWQARLGSDPAVLGKIIELDGTPYTVIGVMPHNFSFPLGAPDLWVPLAMDGTQKAVRTERVLWGIGRLKPGISLKQARAEYASNWNRLANLYPGADGGRGMEVVDLRDKLLDPSSHNLIVFLVGAVGFVLLLACANVANLQLARAAGRQREIALRLALGASRLRVGRQLLTESVLLSTLGAGAGLLLAVWGVSVLRASIPADIVKYIGDWYSLSVDRRAFAFTLILAVLAGIISGLAPARQNSRIELNDALKEAGGRSATGRSHRLRNLLVVAQVSVALLLLVGTSLMIRGFSALRNEKPDLDPGKLMTIRVRLPESRYKGPQQMQAFYDQSLEKIKTVAGVQSAAIASGVPYSFYDGTAIVNVEGRPAPTPGQEPTALPESVSADYFRTLRIPLRRGRGFDQRDGMGAPLVAVISESMAQRLWPGEDSVGKHFTVGSPGNSQNPALTVIGVVGDIRTDAFERSYRSILYRPYQQVPVRAVDYVLRTGPDPYSMYNAVRAQFLLVDKDQPIDRSETVLKQLNDQVIALNYAAVFMAIFGVIALVLTCVGVYGVMAYSVAERTHEIGLRMALGATRGGVLRTVMWRGVKLTGIGLAMGWTLSLALSRLLQSVIHGVGAWDALTFTGVPIILIAVALTACYIPARRATQVDPMEALRYE